jgi:Protein of unknown function (DUF3460)
LFRLDTLAVKSRIGFFSLWNTTMYQSDITQFLNQLKQEHPQLEEQQRKGRSLLWDKAPIDLDERTRLQQAGVPQTPYVYYQNF